MPTAYELVDTAIKILGGAFITGLASYVITRNQHRHDERKSEIATRRALVERVATELSAYYASPTAAQHVLNLHMRGQVGEDVIHSTIDQLAHGHDRLATAIYSASLLGDAELMVALDRYWDVATAIYLEFRNQSELSTARFGKHLQDLSSQSAAVRKRLSFVYEQVGSSRNCRNTGRRELSTSQRRVTA